MGDGDVPPYVGEVPLELPMGLATTQPVSSTQYVNPTEDWESRPGRPAPQPLHQPPVDTGNGGLGQSRYCWESVALPLPQKEDCFPEAFHRTFQSGSTPTHSLPPPSLNGAHSTSRDPTNAQGQHAYLSQFHAQAAYPDGVFGSSVDITQEHRFPYCLPRVDSGSLRASPGNLLDTEASSICSAYVHVTKEGNGHTWDELQKSEVQDVDEQIIVPMETALVGGWVAVEQALMLDVTQQGAAAAVNQGLAIKEEPELEEPEEQRRKRQRENLRKQTSDTRTMRACIRCHNQRVRCLPNVDNPNDPLAPCVTCLKVRRESKKTIHNLPCLRYKLASVVLQRDGGLGYTKRFDHTQLINIRANDWADNHIKVIEMAQGLCETPMTLKVRAFRAVEGDQLVRNFVGRDGIRIPAYGLVNVKEHGRAFQHYIAANAIKGLEDSAKDSDDLVKDMYSMIAEHLRQSSRHKQNREENRDKKSVDLAEFLLKAVRLWFAIRHQTGSAWICGQESLGMESRELKTRYIPRMIVAQFDSIRYHTVFKSQVPQFLSMFEKILSSGPELWKDSKDAWFTAFLVVFLFLHNVACICKDRYRHAKENSKGRPLETRYGPRDHPLTTFVEDVQHGAGVMLAYWTYFKRCDLMNFEWDAESVSKSAIKYLDTRQLAFLKGTIDCLKDKTTSIPSTPQEGCWEHELYWISLMFVSEPSMTNSWKPPVVFSTVNPSVGNEQ